MAISTCFDSESEGKENNEMSHNTDNLMMKKAKLDPRLLDTFWKLAEPNDDLRITASLNLSGILKGIQDKQASKLPSFELNYSLERLIKGLSSTRRAARFGYYLALTDILKTLSSEVDFSDTLFTLSKKYLPLKGDSEEKRNSSIGLALLYAALERSDYLIKSLDVLPEAFKHLWDLTKKPHVANVAARTLVNLLYKVGESTFNSVIYDIIARELEKGWDTGDFDYNFYWIFITCTSLFPDKCGKKFLNTHWDCKHIMTSKNLPYLAKIVSQSTACHPRVHDVGQVLVKLAIERGHLNEFWTFVVDDVLMSNKHHEKQFLAYGLVKDTLMKTTSSQEVEVVLSPNIIKSLMQNLSGHHNVLHSAAVSTISTIVKFAELQKNPRMQLAVIKKLTTQPGSIQFDKITKTGTVGSIIRHLRPDACEEFVDILKKEVEFSQEGSGESKGTPSKLITAIAQLSSLAGSSTPAVQLDVAKFLFLRAFFSEKTVLSEKCREDVFKSVLRCLNDFPKPTVHRAGVDEGESFNADRHLAMLNDLVSYIDTLIVKKDPAVDNWNAKTKKHWKLCLDHMKKVSVKSGDTKGQLATIATVLNLLFGHTAIQLLFSESNEMIPVIKELGAMTDHFFGVVPKSNDEDDEEPNWTEVVTNLLLTLLPRHSQIFRTISCHALTMVVHFITPEALQLIIDVLNPLKIEDQVQESSEDEDSDDERSGDDEGSKSDVESEEETVDDALRIRLRTALGTAAVGEDAADEGSDLDDEAMCKLDSVLAEAFRVAFQHKRERKDDAKMKEQLKNRAIELLDIVIKNRSTLTFSLMCLEALLAAITTGLRTKGNQSTVAKATNSLSRLLKSKFTKDENVSVNINVTEVLTDLLTRARKDVAQSRTMSDASVFVLKCAAFMDRGTTKGKKDVADSHTPITLKTAGPLAAACLEIFKTALSDMMSDTHQYPPIVFNKLFEHYRALVWDFRDILVEAALSPNHDVKHYNKALACKLLSGYMLNKNLIHATVGEADWCAFFKQICKAAGEAIIILSQSEKISFKYLNELLTLLLMVVDVNAKFNEGTPLNAEAVLQQSTFDLLKSLEAKFPNKMRNIMKSLQRKLNMNPSDNAKSITPASSQTTVSPVSNPPTSTAKSDKKKKRKSMESNFPALNEKPNATQRPVGPVVDAQPEETESPKKRKKCKALTKVLDQVKITPKSTMTQKGNAEDDLLPLPPSPQIETESKTAKRKSVEFKLQEIDEKDVSISEVTTTGKKKHTRKRSMEYVLAEAKKLGLVEEGEGEGESHVTGSVRKSARKKTPKV